MSGGSVPHFIVHTLDGHGVDYAVNVWQRRNLVLVALPVFTSRAADDYAARLGSHAEEFAARCATLVITRDSIDGVRPPAALVTDRWGEIVHAVSVSAVEDLPHPVDLLDWLDYVEQRCPECEGEAR